MAEDTLAQSGLYLDELNKVRVLRPEAAQQTAELRDECELFTNKISDFQTKSDFFIEIVDTLAKDVSRTKMQAIGSRSQLHSLSKQREAQRQQQAALMAEKKLQLTRLQKQYESLKKVEAEQNDFIEQFLLHR